MEVTSENFDAELGNVLRAVEEAEVFAFDCEFSGLGKGTMGIGPYDTAELAYAALRANVEDYLIVQLGLTAFARQEDGTWAYSSWSFYLFPRIPRPARSFKNVYASTSAAMDTDSLDFLSQQGFDFNKWVHKGVNYLRPDQADSLHKEIQRRFDWGSEHSEDPKGRPEPKIPDAFKPKLNRYLKEVAEYLAGVGEPTAETAPLLLREVTIEERKLTEAALASKYGKALYTERVTDIVEGGHKVFCLAVHSCPSLAHHKRHRERRTANDHKDVEAARGFAQLKVMSALSASGKPLVGHYIGLDLLHCFKAFHKDLPSTWAQFRSQVPDFLPLIYDTKFLASAPSLRASLSDGGGSQSLGELRLATQNLSFADLDLRPKEERLGYGSEGAGQLHDAGYDSFVTGSLFLRFAYALTKTKPSSPLPLGELASWANRFSPGRVRDLPYLTVGKGDPEPKLQRDHIFFLESSSEAWGREDIQSLFSPYGNVNIAWLNKTAAFVALFNKGNAEKAAAALIDSRRRLGHRGLVELKVGGGESSKERNASLVSVSVSRLDEHTRQREKALGVPPAKAPSSASSSASPPRKVPAPPIHSR